MTKLQKIAAMTVAALGLSACNSTVNSFVRGATPPSQSPDSATPTPAPPAQPTPQTDGPMALKISPGHVRSAGPSKVSMEATVTPTQRTLTSPNISAEISIHRRQVSP